MEFRGYILEGNTNEINREKKTIIVSEFVSSKLDRLYDLTNGYSKRDNGAIQKAKSLLKTINTYDKYIKGLNVVNVRNSLINYIY